MVKHISHSSLPIHLTADILSQFGIETFQGYKETKEEKTTYFVKKDFNRYSRLLNQYALRLEIYDLDIDTETSEEIFILFIPESPTYDEYIKIICQYIEEYEKEYNYGCSICHRPLPEEQLRYINELLDENDFPVPLYSCEHCLPHN